MIEVLELFTDVTLKAEGDKKPTVILAAPLVFGSIRNLQELLQTSKYCVSLIFEITALYGHKI